MKKTKVVLLGDSIRLIGYGTAVPELLGDAYEVWQPESNGRFVSNGLRDLYDMAEKINEADIVHFNSGEWDVCDLFGDGPFTPVEFYVSQILRIADILLKKGKTVIFATTTPVRPENKHSKNDVIKKYNAAVVPLLKDRGVIINDLYKIVAEDIYENVGDDNIHLTQTGTKRCAESTVATIINATKQ